MISKNQIKYIRSLQQKKYRDELKLFVAEGPKVVNDLLQSNYVVREIFTTDLKLINTSKNVYEIKEKELESISSFHTPNKILAVFEVKTNTVDINSLKDKLVIALDDMRDPGNLGTIVRLADWFGIINVICSETCVDLYNPKTIQSTMGSIARVNVVYASLEEVLPKFKNVYGAVLDGHSIYKEKLAAEAVVVIGSESHGISESLLKFITHKISIPSFSLGADSLNAATACAIICSEFKRALAT